MLLMVMLELMPDQSITQPFFAKTIDVWKKQGWFIRELYNYFNNIKYTNEEILHIYKTEYMMNIMDASIDPVEEWLQQLSEDDTQIAVYETARRKEFKNVKFVTTETSIRFILFDVSQWIQDEYEIIYTRTDQIPKVCDESGL